MLVAGGWTVNWGVESVLAGSDWLGAGDALHILTA